MHYRSTDEGEAGSIRISSLPIDSTSVSPLIVFGIPTILIRAPWKLPLVVQESSRRKYRV